jgi:penicillin-binding protein 1A
MAVAVANRPVEQFETQVPMPDWQLEPEEQYLGDDYIDLNTQPLVDENGNPIAQSQAYGVDAYGNPVPLPPQQQQQQGPLTQQWLDNVLGNGRERPGAVPPPQTQSQQRPSAQPPAQQPATPPQSPAPQQRSPALADPP